MMLQAQRNERKQQPEEVRKCLYSVSMVMPFLNEAEYIRMTISEAKRVLDALGADYEIILVDDASTDGSEKIARELARVEPRIKVFHHQRNQGLGAALKTGYQNAMKEIIVYSDVDMPFEFSVLSEVFELLDGADIIHGYRVGKRESFLRAVYSRVYNSMIRTLFHFKTDDINFAMTIFKRKVLDGLLLRSDGSFFSAEFMLKSYYQGYKILEIPARFNHRKYGRSRLASANHIMRIINEMVRYCPEILELRRRANERKDHG